MVTPQGKMEKSLFPGCLFPTLVFGLRGCLGPSHGAMLEGSTPSAETQRELGAPTRNPQR